MIEEKTNVRFISKSGAAFQHQNTSHGLEIITAPIMTETTMSITPVRMYLWEYVRI